jgi:peroxiredoxin family protein
MLPKGATKLALSKMHMMGMGTEMMKFVMSQQKVPTLPELMVQAKQMGVKFIACEMAMNVMGLQREELSEVDDVAGIASFAELAKQSGSTLFI